MAHSPVEFGSREDSKAMCKVGTQSCSPSSPITLRALKCSQALCILTLWRWEDLEPLSTRAPVHPQKRVLLARTPGGEGADTVRNEQVPTLPSNPTDSTANPLLLDLSQQVASGSQKCPV